MANVCVAETKGDMHLGSCGFAGAEYLANDYSCNHHSSSNYHIKKEAAKQILSMAWKWMTGAQPTNAAAQYFEARGHKIADGAIEPKFGVSAQSDELYLTVAYEF